MKSEEPRKNWEKTRVQGLYRHKNGNYYSRTFIGSREEWKSHRTKVFSIGEARHRKHQAGVKDRRETQAAVDTGKLTFGQAVQLYLDALKLDTEKKDSTKHYHEQVVRVIQKGFDPDKAIKRISPLECQMWAQRLKGSATRHNGAVGILRAILQVGVVSGVMPSNPAQLIERRSVRPEKPTLPTREQFEKMLEAIRKSGSRHSKPCADFVAGLAYTGLRLSEANRLTWQDVDVEKGTLKVRNIGTGTKNREERTVPLIPDALALFTRMQGEYPDPTPGAPVFLVRESQKALNAAAKKAKMARITHHDLRHLFSTSCIESGVDIPTVSRWLGHKDGGALLMKTYGHLRDDHSMESAKLVRLTLPVTAEPPKEGPASAQAPQ